MASRTGEGGEGLAGDQGGGAPQTFCDAVVEMRHDHSFDYRTRFPAGFIGRAFLFTRILDPPGDVVIGHLQLGEEDGAVLRPPAVYHRYHLVPLPTAQGAHVPKRLVNCHQY